MPERRLVARDIPIERVEADPDQPRKHFAKEPLLELADSIRELGVCEPIIVRQVKAGSDPVYRIISGERRFRASQIAGKTDIPAVIRNDLDGADIFAVQLVENQVRQDMTAMEEASAYVELMKQGKTKEQIAAMIGRTVPFVDIRLELLNLIPLLQMSINAGTLTVISGSRIAKLSPTNQSKVARMIAEGKALRTVADVAAVCEQLYAMEHGCEMFADVETLTEPQQRALRDYETALDTASRAIAALDKIEDPQLLGALQANLPGYVQKALVLKDEAARLGRRLNRLQHMHQTTLAEAMAS